MSVHFCISNPCTICFPTMIYNMAPFYLTAPEACGSCVQCGYELFSGIQHLCPTSAKLGILIYQQQCQES